jgi:hypothetical protein
VDKAVGGGSVKAFPRFGGIKPGGEKSQEGRDVSGWLNRWSEVVALIVGSKALKPGSLCWSHLRKGRHGGGNGRRAAAGDDPVRLCDVAKSLKGKPWTWLRDETSLQGTWWSKPSRAGGTPRTERSERLGAFRNRWTPRADVAMRERGTPQEALVVAGVGLVRGFGRGQVSKLETAGR